jgi:hypothetical protein
MKILMPFLAAALFLALTLFFTPFIPQVAASGGMGIHLFYYLSGLLPYHLNPVSVSGYFISSPFNMQTEGDPLYNLFLPTVLIFLIGFYLKNFNKSFQKKCNLGAVFTMSILASYVKSCGSMIYYRGYSEFGISLGTSIITLCFLAVLVISLEFYLREKEKVQHLYGRFIFTILFCLILLMAIFIFLSFFATSSLLVHAMGLTAFMLLFIPYYERANIQRILFKRRKGAMLPNHFSP